MPKAVRRLRGGGPDDVTGLIHGEDRGMSTLSLDIKNSTVFTGSDRPAEVMLTLNQLIIELAAEQRHTARRQRLSRRRLPGAVYRWGRPPPRSRRGARHERRNRPLQRTTRDPLVCCCSSRTSASVPVWRFREYRHLRQDKLHGGRRGGKSRRPQAKPGVPSVSEETWRAARTITKENLPSRSSSRRGGCQEIDDRLDRPCGRPSIAQPCSLGRIDSLTALGGRSMRTMGSGLRRCDKRSPRHLQF